MLIFTVTQPLDVPLDCGEVDPDKIKRSFWPVAGELAEKAGCYVFAVPRKNGGIGFVPIYVGKAARPFRDECFHSEKLAKINRYLHHHPAACLKLFLLVHPTNRGRLNRPAITQLETMLIRMAVAVHPRLINKKNTRPENWGIRGVLRGGKGKRSQGALELRAVLGFDDGEESDGAQEVTSPAAALAPVEVENQLVVPVVEQQTGSAAIQ